MSPKAARERKAAMDAEPYYEDAAFNIYHEHLDADMAGALGLLDRCEAMLQIMATARDDEACIVCGCRDGRPHLDACRVRLLLQDLSAPTGR